jgi:sulfur carrier protein ThiS
MSISVKLSTTLRARVPGYDPLEGLELEHAPGLTAAGIMERLGIPPAEVKVVMINGRSAAPQSPVADGDRVGLFPAVGGG